MLHGCSQDPDDFSAGTRMNEVAEGDGCVVVYPEQIASANPGKCWNWFGPFDHSRGRGEASIVAGITREVIRAHGIDEKRVYIAGLSAGGAMAVVLAAIYPQLYAAVGCHSGMPYQSAQNLFAALGVMRNGSEHIRPLGTIGIPLIAFHGDNDSTVNQRNSEQLMTQWIESMPNPAAVAKPVETSGEANGRGFLRRLYRDGSSRPLAEYWLIHGLGHAWSGGNSEASYADSSGPDASREMVRFFLESGRTAAGRVEGPRRIARRLLNALRGRSG